MGCSKPEACQLWAFSQYASHLQPGKEDATVTSQRTKQLGAGNVRNLFTNNLTFWQQLVDGTLYQLCKELLLQARGKSGHQVHCFLNRPADTANKDSPAFSTRFSKVFQTTYFLWATEGNWSDGLQMSASNEQISQVQITFPSLKTRSTFSGSVRILDSLATRLRMQTQMWQKETSALQNHDHAPATAGAQGLEEGLNCNGLIFPSYCLIKIFSTLFRIQNWAIVQ